MVDPITTRRLTFQAIFLAIAAATLFLRLLPITPVTHGIPGPDIMQAFVFAWLLRRPDYVPAVLIVAVTLLEDLLYWRPIGLWPLMMLAGTEFLRARTRATRNLSFLAELVMVAGVMLAMLIANRLVLAFTLVDQPPVGLDLLRYLMTLLAYPCVVLLSRLAFGLRRPVPGEAMTLVHRA